eukprot:CAMPEP_0171621598 /NCGR_PEP_ID=MMETSP0990-20121206/16710_1 /TAXON_ID=483369 /ORGANISM="non described non described, Strain CCMP2098" /LENGTH=106 /DNA_ID=CAMNT_0012187169 /DNA_START=340 /DNA_END=656 /DNA_ORIENTATION=+
MQALLFRGGVRFVREPNGSKQAPSQLPSQHAHLRPLRGTEQGGVFLRAPQKIRHDLVHRAKRDVLVRLPPAAPEQKREVVRHAQKLPKVHPLLQRKGVIQLRCLVS